MARQKKEKDALDLLIDNFDLNGLTQDDLLGQNGLVKQMTKKLLERAMNAEIENHLGYSKNCASGNNSGNSRNGTSKKTILTENQQVDLDIPRDRNGSFESVIIPKHEKRVPLFNDQIISLYGGGMTTRDIKTHLEKIYGIEVSPELISNITNAVLDEVKEWQNRDLDEVYPVVYLDALVVKSRESGKSCNKAVFAALGVNMEGQKELLGLWIGDNEGAKFWMRVLTELNNRGVKDILIACTDGLTGFPDAIHAVFPFTKIQLCIVHMVRNSTKYVSFKERKELCADLRSVYTSATEEMALEKLEVFGKKWENSYPMIYRSWKKHWENLNEFFDYPHDLRKMIYTTNAIESLNFTLRKVTKNRLAFPNDDAIMKIMYLASQNAAKKWTMPVRNWGKALNQFAIYFGDRVPL